MATPDFCAQHRLSLIHIFHFECAAYIWKNPVINDIELDFFHTLEKCQRIDLENCKKYNPIAKVAGQIPVSYTHLIVIFIAKRSRKEFDEEYELHSKGTGATA